MYLAIFVTGVWNKSYRLRKNLLAIGQLLMSDDNYMVYFNCKFCWSGVHFVLDQFNIATATDLNLVFAKNNCNAKILLQSWSATTHSSTRSMFNFFLFPLNYL